MAGAGGIQVTSPIQIAPAAVRKPAPQLGVRDNVQTISWVMGFVYVGDGTTGVADSVYFSPAQPISGKTLTICRGYVPIAAADAQFGSSYGSDVEKHFARKKILAQSVHLHSLIPSTSNSLEVVVAPGRGAYGLNTLASGSNGDAGIATFAANAYQNVLSMMDMFSLSSWEDIVKDLSRYVAGGFGAKQNEFDLQNPWASDATLIDGQSGDLVVPSTIFVGGVNSTPGLRGLRTHAIVVTQTVQLIDWIGSASAFTVGLATSGKVRTQSSILDALARRRKQNALVDALMAEEKTSLPMQSEQESKDQRDTIACPPAAASRAEHLSRSTPVVSTPANTPRDGWFKVPQMSTAK